MSDPQALPAYQAQLKEDLRGPDLPGSLNDLAVNYRTVLKERDTLKASPGVRVPGADAKPEEIAAFHKAIGVPDTVDGYKLEVPEGAPEAEVKAFAAEALKAGYTPAQVKAALAFYGSSIKRALEAHRKSVAEQRAATVAALKAELAGNDEVKFKEIVERIGRIVADPALKDELEKGMGDNPRLIKWIAQKVVPLFKEDGSPVSGNPARGGGGPMTKEQLQKEYPNSPQMWG